MSGNDTNAQVDNTEKSFFSNDQILNGKFCHTKLELVKLRKAIDSYRITIEECGLLLDDYNTEETASKSASDDDVDEYHTNEILGAYNLCLEQLREVLSRMSICNLIEGDKQLEALIRSGLMLDLNQSILYLSYSNDISEGDLFSNDDVLSHFLDIVKKYENKILYKQNLAEYVGDLKLACIHGRPFPYQTFEEWIELKAHETGRNKNSSKDNSTTDEIEGDSSDYESEEAQDGSRIHGADEVVQDDGGNPVVR